jgi:hypothetical protein
MKKNGHGGERVSVLKVGRIDQFTGPQLGWTFRDLSAVRLIS